MLYQSRSEDIINKKMVLEKALFSIEENQQNQSLLTALRDLNEFSNKNKMFFLNLLIKFGVEIILEMWLSWRR